VNNGQKEGKQSRSLDALFLDVSFGLTDGKTAQEKKKYTVGLTKRKLKSPLSSELFPKLPFH
jgi:hypothetical protein